MYWLKLHSVNIDSFLEQKKTVKIGPFHSNKPIGHLITVLKNYFTHKRANSFTILVAIIKIFSPADAGIVLKMVSNIMQGALKKWATFEPYWPKYPDFSLPANAGIEIAVSKYYAESRQKKGHFFTLLLATEFLLPFLPPPRHFRMGTPL